jgi:hypothetical protein
MHPLSQLLLVYPLLLAFLLLSCQCCWQHHCYAGTITVVSTVVCIPAVAGILLLLRSAVVGITYVPNVPADFHAVALFLLLLASLLLMASLLLRWE